MGQNSLIKAIKLVKYLKVFMKRLIYILLLNPLFIYGQLSNQTIDQILNEDVRKMRINKSTYLDDKFLSLDARVVLNSLKKLNNDSSANIRFAAQTLQFKIAMSDSSTTIKGEVANRLVEDCFDTDPLINQQAAKRLLSFRAANFSDKTKALIRKLLQKDKINPEFILLIGIAQIQESIPELSILTDGLGQSKSRWYSSIQWYATLAYARLGNNTKIKAAINMVESESDEILRVTRLLGDIAYIRQPESIKLLQTYLESEERLPRLKPPVPGIKYNQYALNFLTQFIDGFPIKNKGVGYSEEELEIARNWMKNHSNYEIVR